MNDRFTFRAWNIAQKRYMEDLRLIGFGELNTFREVEEAELDKYGQPQHYTVYEEDEVVLEQCTGQKDDNNNLLFENDIIYDPSEDTYKLIYWDNNKAAWCLQWENICGQYLEDGSDFQLYGNIHENPELLKESK